MSMIKLIEKLMLTNNEHYETYKEYEDLSMTSQHSLDYFQSKKRAAVIGWINDELGHEIVKCSTHSFSIAEDEYNWEMADEMLLPLVDGK